MPSEHDRSLCVYCGNASADNDHVPPKAVFPRPLPIDLITVPSCRECNAGFARDDEYFSFVMSVRDKGERTMLAEEPRERLTRGLDRPQARRFREALVRAMGEFESITPGGLYAGSRPGIQVDLKRVYRVVERTVRGLYWHEYGHALPPGVSVAVHAIEGLGKSEKGRANLKIVADALPSIPRRFIGERAFAYALARSPDLGEHGSTWVLGFFGSVDFIATTADRDVAGKPDVGGAE